MTCQTARELYGMGDPQPERRLTRNLHPKLLDYADSGVGNRNTFVVDYVVLRYRHAARQTGSYGKGGWRSEAPKLPIFAKGKPNRGKDRANPGPFDPL